MGSVTSWPFIYGLADVSAIYGWRQRDLALSMTSLYMRIPAQAIEV